MDIRKEEDALFKEWASRRHPFATDGCADPDRYKKSRQKIVFVLKERNWKHSIEEQRGLQSEGAGEFVDEREIFDSWWARMAQWADVLLPNEGSENTWPQIERSFEPESDLTDDDDVKKKWIQERNKEALGKCACIQLKKAPGGGELNKEDLVTVVTQDKALLLRQMTIYLPHFIISCGSNDSWDIFTNILFDDPKIEQSKNGIHYFIVDLGASNHKTAVVNFAHPSMRVNATLWGALAYGLRDALEEISPRLMRS